MRFYPEVVVVVIVGYSNVPRYQSELCMIPCVC